MVESVQARLLESQQYSDTERQQLFTLGWKTADDIRIDSAGSKSYTQFIKDGGWLISTGSQNAFLNLGMLCQAGDTEFIQQSASFLTENALPGALFIPSALITQQVEEQLANQGFEYGWSDPMMEIDLNAYEKPLEKNPAVEIRTVRFASSLERLAVAELQQHGFGFDPNERFSMIAHGEEMTVFLGIENGEAVSTATLIHSKDTPSEASVWSVAVHPDHQKRGHGYDIMHHLTQAAKDRNIHTLRLFASADGLHMYEKMGYKPVPGGTTHIFKLSSPQQ